MIKSPKSVKPALFALAAVAFAGIAGAAPAEVASLGATDVGIVPAPVVAPVVAPPMDAAFRAAYPVVAGPTVTALAGVDLAAVIPAGLRVTERSVFDTAESGMSLSLSDLSGVVRVLLHVAVTRDAKAARAIVDQELHGVSTQLLPAAAALGSPAWADDGGKGGSLVIAAHGNIAYSVHVVGDGVGVPDAAAVAASVRAHMIAGAPTFAAVAVRVPATIDAKKGDDLHVTVEGGLPYEVRAEGGYVAHGSSGPKLRPFGPGKVTVYATVFDALGRVSVGEATTVAK